MSELTRERLLEAYKALTRGTKLGNDATYCPTCDATFEPHEEGYDEPICFECGARNVFKIEW